ncbi:MAG: acyl-CoA thioesterase [Rhodoferax sp.]
MPTPFVFLLRVRYGECDAQQVVFNARYGDYADVAVTEFFRVLFGGVQGLLAQNLDTQVVRMVVDWQAPARFDDVLALHVQTLRVGNTSFQIGMQIENFASKTAIADVDLTYVLVSADAHTKVSVPETLRQQLLAGAPGQVINQSGLPVA